MKTRFSHLTLSDRRQIERWRLARRSATDIAARLGLHRSTVFRELRRNRYHDAEIPELSGYWSVPTQKIALSRRFRPRELVRHPDLRHRVTRCLRAGWSPEQIAACASKRPRSVSAKRRSTSSFIPTRAARRSCGATSPRVAASAADTVDVNSHHRNSPRNSASCSVPTPWPVAENSATGRVIPYFFGSVRSGECDDVDRAGQQVPGRAQEPGKASEADHRPDRRSPAPPAAGARRSVTFDRASEFVDWPRLRAEVGAQTWFRDPRSPWRKGSVVNANKRLRRWIHRDTDPETLSQDDLRRLRAGLNGRASQGGAAEAVTGFPDRGGLLSQPEPRHSPDDQTHGGPARSGGKECRCGPVARDDRLRP
ncbi:MAG: hypothetical protein DI556_20935 [Rhodovulum sulfidophilum]|uniref:Transposase IS30-like HTH domain-containing protein n=1 Tax=Rhodovulum sulfidophilum TaxID=35806 RepID=A0A2W5N1F0_RHOSU|nr:MAG: hypothetical protein DI556_20935 [Rhodovulum sulfidophilum]